MAMTSGPGNGDCGNRRGEDAIVLGGHSLRPALAGAFAGFTFAAITMLGLGVGSSTAIFGIVESVLLRPLPYPASQRIVTLAEVDETGRRLRVSLPDFKDWAAQAESFEAIAALRGDSTTQATDNTVMAWKRVN